MPFFEPCDPLKQNTEGPTLDPFFLNNPQRVLCFCWASKLGATSSTCLLGQPHSPFLLFCVWCVYCLASCLFGGHSFNLPTEQRRGQSFCQRRAEVEHVFGLDYSVPRELVGKPFLRRIWAPLLRINFNLLKNVFVFSPVGFKGNPALLEMCLFFPGGLSKWQSSLKYKKG